MTPEQFEQAKREFAEKLIRFFWQNGNDDYHECKSQFDRIRDQNDCVSNYIDDFLSDLTALLEQHKEMMLREELIKFTEWQDREIKVDRSDGWLRMIDKYLKNVKR